MKSEQMPAPQHPNINHGKGRFNKIFDLYSYHYGRVIEEEIPGKPRPVQESKGEANSLLFGITVIVLVGIMGGGIFLAMHQFKVSNPLLKITPISNQS